MERVFVHGNNKTPQELREAISAGVGRIVVDSRIELGRISKIAGELGVTQDIYMRITPGVEADTHQYIRTGCEDSKFGFTMREDFAYGCVKDVLAAANVRLVGLHCHIGSQIFALHSFAEAVQVMVEFIARVKETYGYEVEELDMGGGLGVAYTADDKPASIDEFAECTVNAVRENCERLGVKLPRLAVEPGSAAPAWHASSCLPPSNPAPPWSPPTRRCWPSTVRRSTRPPKPRASTSTSKPPWAAPSRSSSRCANPSSETRSSSTSWWRAMF